MFFPGYEEIDESKMDPPQIQKSNKGPPLPCRWKMMRQLKGNRSQIASLITSNYNDVEASDTDFGYEYVANPMKKRNRSAAGKSTDSKEQQHTVSPDNGKYCQSFWVKAI